MRLLALFVVLPCLSSADNRFKYLFNIGGAGVNTSVVLPSNIVQNKIVLITTYFGRYPCIGCSGHEGEWCNGGLPQLANWTLHREKVASDLIPRVPDENYDGYIVLDYESWSVPWQRAGALYQNASIALAATRMPPGSPPEAVEERARKEYNRAAVGFLAKTAQFVQSLRPKALVGYYGYPRHTYWGSPANESRWNNELGVLWQNISVLYPSIYLPYGTLPSCTGKGCATVAQQRQWVDGGINESARISVKFFNGRAPIVPYSWYRYHDGGPKSLQLLSTYDASLEFVRAFRIATSLDAHMPYVIIWGNERTSLEYEQAVSWIRSHEDIFGPDSTNLDFNSSERRYAHLEGEPEGVRVEARGLGVQTVTTFGRTEAIPPFQVCDL